MKRSPRDGALAASVLILVLTLLAASASGNPIPERPVPAPVPEDWTGTGTGGLHVITDGHVRELELPLKHTAVDAEISGPVARVVVTQTFQNPFPETIEAIYVFPLPHEAAVNDLEMRIGDRVIRGLIERRDEARRIYEQARDHGHVAALLEEERANIFTQSVANILPGNEIEIRLTYLEVLEVERGTREFVFPMVVGPRFIPPAGGDVVPAGTFVPVPPPVPDANRINPPFLPPGTRSGHDIEVSVRLDAGVPIHRMESRTHVVRIDRDGASRAAVTLSPLDTIPNKDFVLAWDVEGDAPEVGVLTRHDGEQGWVTVLLHPKLDPREDEITAKEMIFVLDCSGSMQGEPIAAAKALLRHAVRNLRSGDTFQIVRFSENASGHSPAPVPASPEEVRRGLAYLDRLQGGGGTMMIRGIEAALDTPRDPSRLRIVMFLTDGYIGNESEILAAVRAKVGDARLFSFGVGSSVNRFLLDRMAEEGRGEVQYFLPGSEVQREVAKFYDRIRSPYLTDLALVWEGVEVQDAYPARVPDLFQGRPLVVHGRYTDGGRGALRVSGRLAGRTWEKRIPLDLPSRESGNPAIASLWARARIADLEKGMLGREDPATVEEITRLALRHRLVTRYTSFVAVEETMVVSDGAPRPVRVPVEMPEGVSWEGVFGSPVRQMVGAPPSRGPDAKKSIGLAAPGTPSTAELFSAEGGQVYFRRVRESVAEPVEESDRAEKSLPADAPAMTAVQLRLECRAAEVRRGEPLTVTLEIKNGSRHAVDLPAALLEVAGALPLLRVIDASWNVTSAGERPLAGAKTRTLAAGAVERRTLVLDTKDASLFPRPGIYHLIVEGGPFGAKDSNRITVRIVE